MTARIKHLVCCGLMICVIAGLAGCFLSQHPPFDANGDYTGTWESEGTTCDFSMTLYQEPTLPYPVSLGILGVVDFNYDCVLDPELLEAILAELPDFVIPVIGTMGDDGSINLGVDTGALGDFPITVALEYDGNGADTNADGKMDAFCGDYTLSLAFTTDVPGYEAVDVTFEGTFGLTRS